MAKQIICLSGWGQDSKSLDFIFQSPDFSDFEVVSLDYSGFGGVDEFFSYVSSSKLNPEIIVGWSLGGQLAVRLIEAGILCPRGLVLIAPPFQMVKDSKIQAGMGVDVFEDFYENFTKAPDAVLQKFAILTAMNDKNSSLIAKNLEITKENHGNLVFWLEELRRFSFFDFDFSKMPKTLYFHGAGDMIVHLSQMQYFKNRIDDFDAKILKKCGHAPHLSDLGFVRKGVCEFLVWGDYLEK